MKRIYWRVRSIVRSFRRPAGWTLDPELPRQHGAPWLHRVILGGRSINGRYTRYDWSWWLHPIRATVYRIERKRAHAHWEEQWGGDPSIRIIVDKLPRLEACAKALMSPNPRLWLIARYLDDERAARGEHQGMGLPRA